MTKSYRITKDTWLSHKGRLLPEGAVITHDELLPLPKVPKIDEKGFAVKDKDGKPVMVEMRLGDNFEPIKNEAASLA